MEIDKKQVKHIAALAKLKIDDRELDKWREQMASIIEFADRLNELDLQNIDVAQQYLLSNVFREDECTPSYSRDEILANAPASKDGCYLVPKIVE